MTRLEKAEMREFEVTRVCRELREERDAKVSKLVEAFRSKVQQEADAEYRDRMEAAQVEYAAADVELNAARLEDAAATIKWPVGTVVCAWDRPRCRLTGKIKGDWHCIAKGIVEIITHESEHPDNLNKYSRSDIGTVVVRLLKKDGTPGRKYEVLGHWRTKSWLPEGQMPGKVDDETGELLPAEG